MTAARKTRDERDRIVLDTAAELFYRRGVHEVGMDELIEHTGLGKATVYRLYATKAELIGGYLERLSTEILGYIDADIARWPDDPARALRAVLAAVRRDIARPEFRGCPFNNASIEFDDPDHPARQVARDYRAALRRRLQRLSRRLVPGRRGSVLGDQLAALVDGAYTSAAHLGPDGPAAAALSLARHLVDDAARRTHE